MRRVSNEIIWAGVTSVVCGVLIASLLGSARTPWILVAAVVVLGLVVTGIRRRRERNTLRAYYEPARKDKPRKRASHAAEDVPTPRESPNGRTRFGSDPPVIRRAGARSRTLGTERASDDPGRRS